MANSLFNFVNLSDLNGTNGFIFNSISQNNGLGTSVSNGGDINGDGIDDLIIGAASASPNGKDGARVVSYKERKNFVQLIGEGALCLRNSSETKLACDRNEKVV